MAPVEPRALTRVFRRPQKDPGLRDVDRAPNARNIGVLFGQRSQLWWDLAVRESLTLLRDMYSLSPEFYRKRLDRLDGLLPFQPN